MLVSCNVTALYIHGHTVLVRESEHRSLELVQSWYKLPRSIPSDSLIAIMISTMDSEINVNLMNDGSAIQSLHFFAVIQARTMANALAKDQDMDVLIVPGVAFDKELRRCGHGGGVVISLL